jgi:hypothetical protein
MKERLHRLCLVPAVLVILPLASCTHEAGQARPAVGGDSAQASEGDGAPASFLANVEAVRSSPAYRQNCWMIPKGGGDDSTSAALCIDLKQQVHLVVFSKRVPRKLSGKMREYEVSASRLRASMDPDAFVVDGRNVPVVGIFRVPEGCPEAFGADAINSLLGTRWKPGDFGFQYD